MKIKPFNKIDELGMDILRKHFVITDNNDYEGIILRSYKMTEEDLTKDLAIIARAGVGVNNILIDKCSEKGIVVVNTPGANANAVKELVITALLLSGRKIVEGINWSSTLKGNDNAEKEVEANKSKFAGKEIMGKKIGVIGLGAIGIKVANTLDGLGMEVFGFDPYLSVDAAWNMKRSIHRASGIDWLLENCDYITVHVPLTADTKNMINKENLKNAKPGIILLNFSRGGIYNDDAVLSGIKNGIVDKYITDFPNAKLVGNENIICLPHLGASTPESESNCAVMAANQLEDYLLNGNIINSVNYPVCVNGSCSSVVRLCVNHRNIPNMVGQISGILAENGINIADMMNKSKGDFAYTMIDADHDISEVVLNQLKNIDGILRVRLILAKDE